MKRAPHHLDSAMNDTATPATAKTVYPPADPSPSFPRIEEAVGAAWEAEKTFQRSIERRREQGAPEFVFYDGPPFANGLPHYGHIVTGFVKDMVPRFQTMRGKMVERRFGWDCHGLPAELHSEKELNLNGRQDILKYGLARFNEHCRTSIMQFRSDWEYYVNRSARWVDFENDYRTMDLSYMESTIWAFKQLWDKGLVYEGYRVVPYSWAAQTPLSQSETRLDDSYRARQDPALTIGFLLDGWRHQYAAACLDDDAVDAALQCRPGCGARRRLCGDGEGRRAGDPGAKLAGSLCAGAGRLPP